MSRMLKWLAVAGCVVVLGAVAGRIHHVRAADEGSVSDRTPGGEDAARRLDRIIEKLDRVVDRMQSERMGPPGPPPHRRGDHGGPREHGSREHGGPDHQGPEESWHGGPGDRGRPGMWSEGRPPRPEMPPEMREMIERRMQEGRRRMEQAREKFRELEERVKKLEAEIERLKAA